MSKTTTPYQKTLDYLYSQLPMFQRTGAAAFKKDLTNIRKLCEALGNPQEQFRSIHIAGTNGKGSVAYMLSAILQAHGYKTGLYVSPHYKDFRERIRINGTYVSRQFIIDFTQKIKPLAEGIQPSFFEMTVAMAFAYFAEQQVDVAVVEVGMGGRLDSTNMLTPVLSVITNIGYDHMQFLGDTLPLIAGEKAGIIKPGVPVVIGETHPETQSVFEQKATQEKAPIIFADQHFRAQVKASTLLQTTFDVYQNEQLRYADLQVNAYGDYQMKNVQAVLQAAELLRAAFKLEDEKIRYGLEYLRALTRFVGRWQLLGEQPTVLCDSAHNEDGLRSAIQQLKKIPHHNLHIVFGVVQDKDVSRMLALLPREARYYFAKADIPRGLDAKQLQEKAKTFDLEGKTYTSVKNALRAAKRQATPDDLIFVGGSVFVVAEVL